MLSRTLVLSLVSGLSVAASAVAGPTCGIFVSTIGQDDPGGGLSTGDPVATINFALVRAVQEGVPCVFVQVGTYAEIVKPTFGVSIDGGYDAEWVRDAYNQPGHEVRIIGSSDKMLGQFVTVVAENVAGTVSLSNLVIEAPDALGTIGGAGMGSYAVYAVNTTILMLEDVLIDAGDGANGDSGMAGSDASQMPAPGGLSGGGGFHVGSCNSSIVILGSPGAINGGDMNSRGGGGGTGGRADADCGIFPDFDPTPGFNGGNATLSMTGVFGTGGVRGQFECAGGMAGLVGRVRDGNGGPGGSTGGVLVGAWFSQSGAPGSLGDNGGGGGGGGGAFGCDTGGNFTGSAGGSGGAGGTRAPGVGTHGFGGGGSFGVFAVDSDVAMVNVEVMQGLGGDGGSGGAGGTGQPGGAGGNGGASPGGGANPGGDGGDGGNGGHAGAGGGGAGGPSVGVLVDGGVLNALGVIYTGGTGGAGGLGGAGATVVQNGGDGVIGDVLEDSVNARGAVSDGEALAKLLADQLAVRGVACDAVPCITVACVGDLNDDGVVDSGDLAILLAAWGPCP